MKKIRIFIILFLLIVGGIFIYKKAKVFTTPLSEDYNTLKQNAYNCYFSNRFNEAEAYFQKMLKQQKQTSSHKKDIFSTYFSLGEIALRRERFIDAINMFKEAVKQNDNDANNVRILYSELLKAYIGAYGKTRKGAIFIELTAIEQYKKGFYSGALEYLESVKKIWNRNPEIYRKELNVVNNLRIKWILEIEKRVKFEIDNNKINKVIDIINDFFFKNDFQMCLKIINEVRTTARQRYFNKQVLAKIDGIAGWILYRQNKFKDSTELLSAATAELAVSFPCSPFLSKLYFLQAMAFIKEKKYSNAEICINKALAYLENNKAKVSYFNLPKNRPETEKTINLLWNKILSNLQLSKFEEPLEQSQRIRLYYFLGSILEYGKNYDGAEKCFERAISEYNNKILDKRLIVELFGCMGLSCYKRDKLKKSVLFFQKAIDAAIRVYGSYNLKTLALEYSYAVVLHDLKKDKEALLVLRKIRPIARINYGSKSKIFQKISALLEELK